LDACPPAGASANPRQTLMIVDDVPANIRVLVNALSVDYEIVAATRGNDVLRLAERAKPALILLDIELPDVDGYSLCQQLRQSPSCGQIPVIFVTARDHEADEVRGLRLGAVDYITKPFSSAIVQARVRTHLELKRYRDLLRNRSDSDGLTGLANRRRFDEYLAQQSATALGAGTSLALIMADVDRFKSYNDRYGHLAGDDCLKRVAQTMREVFGDEGVLVARYGGEEFVCVMPETDRGSAQAAAEACRRRLLEAEIAHEGNPPDGLVSLSLGVAVLESIDKQPAHALCARADRALYQAKMRGRNRVCSQ